MAFLLLIETSTKVCSVALAKKFSIVKTVEDNNSDYSHSSQLTVFIRQLIEETGVSFEEIDGVAVSRGPGSYTGLRIGTSVAKGLCYALDIPLIGVDTLKALTVTMLNSPYALQVKDKATLFCPMIDARRMEVYNAVYDNNLKTIKSVSADIIDINSYQDFLEEQRICFFGDGATKCRTVINSENAQFFDQVLPSAVGMASLAYEKFEKKQFEDAAYFEPFYLKDFIAGKPKVKGLD